MTDSKERAVERIRSIVSPWHQPCLTGECWRWQAALSAIAEIVDWAHHGARYDLSITLDKKEEQEGGTKD